MLLYVSIFSLAFCILTADDTVNCPSLMPTFEWSASLRCESCTYLTSAWTAHKHSIEDEWSSLCLTPLVSGAKLMQKPRTAARYWHPGKVAGGRLVLMDDPYAGAMPEPLSPRDNRELGCYGYFLKKYCESFGEKHQEAIEAGAVRGQAFCIDDRAKECDPYALSKAREEDRVRWLKWMGRAHPGKGLNPYVPLEDNPSMHIRNPYAAGGELESLNELLKKGADEDL